MMMIRVASLGVMLYAALWPVHAHPAHHARDIVLEEFGVTLPSGSRGMMVRPAGQGSYPAVLHLHGSGDTVASNVVLLRLFARAGYAAMDVEYRRTTSGSIDLPDIFASFDFLNRAPNVKRGVIAINGFSLGARMALHVAAHRNARAVSAIAARTSSMDTPTVLEEAARLRAPILLQHGVDDSVVPYNDSVLLEKKLKGLGRTVALISYPGAGHNQLPWEQVYSRVLAFFAEHVR